MAVIGIRNAAPVDVLPREGWDVVRDAGPGGGGAAQVGGAVRDAAVGDGGHGGWFAGDGWFGGEGGWFGGEGGWLVGADDGDGFAGGF
jgi:host factor-I protein